MAAGSVINEPMSGTIDNASHVCAKLAGKGMRDANACTARVTPNKMGRDAAMTITTNTNKGSVYCRDSAYAKASWPPFKTAIAPTKMNAQKPKTTSTSLIK